MGITKETVIVIVSISNIVFAIMMMTFLLFYCVSIALMYLLDILIIGNYDVGQEQELAALVIAIELN